MATTLPNTIPNITEIKHQFLAMVPTRNLKLMNVEHSEDPAVQSAILEKTILSPIAKKYLPSAAYRRMFLKTLLNTFEALGIDVCDQMYEEYTKLVAMPEDDTENCYRTYTLPNEDWITVKESTAVISHGTTGLQTWPAALCLAEWAMENIQSLAGKRIVELGCGLGLTGLIICRTCHPSHYVFSDCHQQVLQTLCENIEINKTASDLGRIAGDSLENNDRNLCCKDHDYSSDKEIIGGDIIENGDGENTNGLQSCHSCVRAQCTKTLCKANCQSEEEIYDQCGKEDSASSIIGRFDCKISMERLDWESIEDDFLKNLHADVILAADVVYDTSIVPSLVRVLHKLLHINDQERRTPPVAYIASTIRNEETHQCFMQALDMHGIKMRQCELPSQQVFYYDKSCPITILQLSL